MYYTLMNMYDHKIGLLERLPRLHRAFAICAKTPRGFAARDRTFGARRPLTPTRGDFDKDYSKTLRMSCPTIFCITVAHALVFSSKFESKQMDEQFHFRLIYWPTCRNIYTFWVNLSHFSHILNRSMMTN
jgi:hypothetical protein